MVNIASATSKALNNYALRIRSAKTLGNPVSMAEWNLMIDAEQELENRMAKTKKRKGGKKC